MRPHLRRPLSLLLLASALLTTACVQQNSRLVSIADLPLKSTALTSMSWQTSPIRANAQYALYGANSGKEARDRLGDYYYVAWYDAEPTRPARLVMRYTQAATASEVLTRTMEFNEPRASAGTRKTPFIFNGPERAKKGDIMTWRIDLYVGDALVDSRHSFLWQD